MLLDSAVVKPADVSTIWQPQILAAAGIDSKRDGANALKVTTVAFDKTARGGRAEATRGGLERIEPDCSISSSTS